MFVYQHVPLAPVLTIAFYCSVSNLRCTQNLLGRTCPQTNGPCGCSSCAHCVDEFTGEQVLQAKDIKANVEPTDITALGNYAVAVHWSDGHTSSVYPYEVLRNL